MAGGKRKGKYATVRRCRPPSCRRPLSVLSRVFLAVFSALLRGGLEVGLVESLGDIRELVSSGWSFWRFEERGKVLPARVDCRGWGGGERGGGFRHVGESVGRRCGAMCRP